MSLDFPNSPTNGTVYNPGAPALGAWVYDGTKWNASGSVGNYVLKTGDTMTGALRVQSAGVVIGPAATATPAAGGLTLNANTVAPPAGLTPQAYLVGANGTGGNLALDSFGSLGLTSGTINFRGARGTAAAPTAVQANDILGYLQAQGATGAGTYGLGGVCGIYMIANENFTSGTQGTFLQFNTVPNGTGVSVVSLKLAGNNATFSGTVNAVGTMGLTASGGGSQLNLGGNHTWQIITNPDNSFNISDLTAPAVRLIITGTGACSASTAWGVISDAAVKTDIVDHPRGLADILKLQPRQFTYSGEHGLEGPGQGLIAQELEAVMPELVGEMATVDGGTVKTVTETGIIWPLVNAVKTLAERLDALEHAARPA